MTGRTVQSKRATHLRAATSAPAMAAGAVALALGAGLPLESAEAVVIIEDIDPDVTLGTYALDVDGDLLPEFTFETGGILVPLLIRTDVITSGNAVVGFEVTDDSITKPGTYAEALGAGELIDASRNFVGGSDVILSGKVGLESFGEFFDVGNAFVGLRFILDGNTHYGWVDVFSDGIGVTLRRYAYESTPDTGIRTPAIAVPEPAGLGLLAAGAAGILLLRRRQRER